MERPGSERHALCASRSDRRIRQRFLAEEHVPWIGPEQLVDAFRVALRPVPDCGPRCLAGLKFALVDQPASDGSVGMVVIAGIGEANLAHSSVRFSDAQPARALDLQHQRVERARDVGDFTAAKRGLRLRHGLQLLARPVRSSCREVGRRRMERHAIRPAGHSSRVQDGLVVAGDEASSAAFQRFDAIGLEVTHQPCAQFRIVARRCPQCGCAKFQPGRRRALTALQQRGPGRLRRVCVPPGQLLPCDGNPARVLARHAADRGRHGGRAGRSWRRSRGAGGQRRERCHGQPLRGAVAARCATGARSHRLHRGTGTR